MNATQTISSMSGGQIKSVRALSAAGAIGVAVVIAAVGWGVINRGGTATASRDPLAQTSVTQFRASEHAEAPAVAKRDVFAAPGLVAFRQSEHATTGGDPLAARASVNFRNSERAENYGSTRTSDPLAAPNLVKFRMSEHSEAGR